MKVYAIKRVLYDETWYLSTINNKNWTRSPADMFFFTDKGYAERTIKGWDKSLNLEVVAVRVVEDD